MFRHILRRKALFAFLGAFFALAQAASAHHDLQYDVTPNSSARDAYPDYGGYTYYGANTPATSTTDIPSGYRVAHHTGSGAPWTSGSNPSDEEQIGSGTAWARWQPFCFSESSLGLTLTWETTIPTGAPANTVSMVQIEAAGGLFVTDAFIVKQGTNDYKIEVPDMPDSSVCSSTTQGLQTMTIWGDTPDGSLVVQNPASAGSYTWTVTYTDTAGGTHSDSDTVSVT